MTELRRPRFYDGDGDILMQRSELEQEPLLLVPDSPPSKLPDTAPRIRIMWGQHLLEDLLAGRYRTLVCAVNAEDNSHGIISQLASLLPTSQWDRNTITDHARQFSAVGEKVKVLKYDMDTVEVLAVGYPTGLQSSIERPGGLKTYLEQSLDVTMSIETRRNLRLPATERDLAPTVAEPVE